MDHGSSPKHIAQIGHWIRKKFKTRNGFSHRYENGRK